MPYARTWSCKLLMSSSTVSAIAGPYAFGSCPTQASDSSDDYLFAATVLFYTSIGLEITNSARNFSFWSRLFVTKPCAPSGLLTVSALTPLVNVVLPLHDPLFIVENREATSYLRHQLCLQPCRRQIYRHEAGTKAISRATNYRDAEGKTQENTKTCREIAGGKLDCIVRDLFRSLEQDSNTL